MKVLMLSPYCYPEQISSSHLTDDLFQTFSNEGVMVDVYAPTPCRGIDKETRKKYQSIKEQTMYDNAIRIHRFSLFAENKNSIARAIRYILGNIIQYHKGIRAKNIDVVFAGSTPPTQGLLCGLVKNKLTKKYRHKVPFVYNLQDVFPESLVSARMTKEGSLLWRIGRRIEDYTYKSADIIITISEDFKANMMSKGVPEEKIVVIPNWVNTDNVYPIDRKDNILFDRYQLDRSLFYVCYSGNIGHSQNWGMLLDAAKEINMPDVMFVLIGEGAAREEVRNRIENEGITNVIMLPFQNYSEISHVFSLGDVGLIISKPGVGGSSVPSKTFSIMAAERPILASFDEDSELCKLIKRSGCGIVADARSKEALIAAIKELRMNPDSRLQMGILGKKYLVENLDKDKCTRQYVELIKNTIC